MQGMHSLRGDLTPTNNNISHIRRLRKHLKRLAAENDLVPIEIEEGTDQINQAMATGGGRQLVMNEYAQPIIGTIVSCIQLGETTHNYELKNVHFTMLLSFYGIPNEDPLIFIRDFYAIV